MTKERRNRSKLTGLDELFSRVERYRSGTEFLELLHFAARFHKYSMFNAALAYVQRPGAKYVLSPSRWLDEFGRTPKLGAQPIVLLRPMGPVMFAYDLCETKGPELPPEVHSPLKVGGQLRADGVVGETIGAARTAGIEILFVPMGSAMGGFAFSPFGPEHSMNVEVVRRGEEGTDAGRSHPGRHAWHDHPWGSIRINKNYDEPRQIFRILTHELGHLYCGHLGGIPGRSGWEARTNLSQSQMEFEAESVSFLVCRRHGLDLRSEAYLRGFIEEHGEIPAISVQRILKAANAILDMGGSQAREGREDIPPSSPDSSESRLP